VALELRHTRVWTHHPAHLLSPFFVLSSSCLIRVPLRIDRFICMSCHRSANNVVHFEATHTIVSCVLAPAKPDCFELAVKHVLVVATLEDICLVAVEIDPVHDQLQLRRCTPCVSKDIIPIVFSVDAPTLTHSHL
jgi:hypothetical protein